MDKILYFEYACPDTTLHCHWTVNVRLELQNKDKSFDKCCITMQQKACFDYSWKQFPCHVSLCSKTEKASISASFTESPPIIEIST